MVKSSFLFSMTEVERGLIASTQRAAMAELDEDALLELHSRVRRSRTKYLKLYRRRGSATVVAAGGRGMSYEQNERNRNKAEVFELALARVSKQVEVRAREAAAELKAERLAAAQQGRSAGPDLVGQVEPGGTAGRARQARKTTGGLKKDASTRAAGARRQAKRDTR